MKKKFILVPVILLLCMITAGAVYFSNYYHASDSVREYRERSGSVTIREIPEGLLLDGPGDAHALVFYPGAKVEYTAYIPLLYTVSEAGTDCFLVRMPANFALFDINRASKIIGSYPYDS